MLQIMALVLLPAGLLWSWNVGPGVASELDQLRQLLPTLPSNSLLVGDCFFQGYQLYTDILRAKASFLVRLSSKTNLYVDHECSLERFKDGEVILLARTNRPGQRQTAVEAACDSDT